MLEEQSMREYYKGYKDDYYDHEDWQQTEEEIKEREEKKVRTRLLTIIQITVCSILLMTALFLRISGSNAYMVIREWYFTNLNQTIIPDERIENVKNKVIELFPAPSSQQPETSKPSSDSAQSAASQSSAVQSAVNSQNGANAQSTPNSQNAEGTQQTAETPAADNTQLIN
jgi:cytoskeletal protein RodZ